MRVRDIDAVKSAIKNVSFVQNFDNEWEIHFYLGDDKKTEQVLTMHYPSDKPRVWKNLHGVWKVAELIFDTNKTHFAIKPKKELK